MNLQFRLVARSLGILTFVLSALIGLVGLFGAFDYVLGTAQDDAALMALMAAALVGVVVGGVLYLIGRQAVRGVELIGGREAILLVALSWLLGAVLAALPFRFWASFRPDAATAPHDFDTYVNCYFEAMSGLTTTGATVVQALATVPRSLLLWRALTQWLGGLGIIVLFVAVLPVLGVGGRRVYRMEVAGPAAEGVRPRIQDTARTLWLIYSGLTVALIVTLRICGMSWFDAVCHAFTALATGGYGTHDASIGRFSSPALQWSTIVFMLLAGVNFGLYYQLLRGRIGFVLKDPELRAYLTILLTAAIIVSFSVLRQAGGDGPDVAQRQGASALVRDSVFQVVSIHTTTGFTTTDYDQWGFAAKAVLLALMFMGPCAGSTGNGIKVVRVLVAVKVILAEIEHTYRPKVVRLVKLGPTTIVPELKLSALVYVISTGVLFTLGMVLLMLFEAGQQIDIASAASATVATMHNVGPGLGRVGATQNYAWLGDASKILLSMLMLLGRLELFTVLALFSPRFWREE